MIVALPIIYRMIIKAYPSDHLGAALPLPLLPFPPLLLLPPEALFWVDRDALRNVVGFVDAHEAVGQLEHVVAEALFIAIIGRRGESDGTNTEPNRTGD